MSDSRGVHCFFHSALPALAWWSSSYYSPRCTLKSKKESRRADSSHFTCLLLLITSELLFRTLRTLSEAVGGTAARSYLAAGRPRRPPRSAGRESEAGVWFASNLRLHVEHRAPLI